jgi:hypothetical protein
VNPTLHFALEYASWGFYVFPLKPRSKEPYPGTHGFKDATRDPARITDTFTQLPDSNVGIATGALSGIWVLDVDAKSGGIESLRDLCNENGNLPLAPVVHTPTGGLHIYFRHRPGIKSKANIARGLDVRADGGYIVAPPSVHPKGGAYSWDFDQGHDLARLLWGPKRVDFKDVDPGIAP